MIYFGWLQNDWKEPFATGDLNFYLERMEGKLEVTELEPGGDLFEYCIHTAGVDEDIVAEVSANKHIFSYSNNPWIKKRYKEKDELLTFQNEEEIMEFLDICNEEG